MNNPTISIIIPIYNVAPYIIECLESVYNQSYPNIEVILVDDCSTDESMQIVDTFLTSDRIKKTTLIHHSQNKGLSETRNTGINHATGDYIYFIDSDDYINSDCIESFVSLAIKYESANVIFGSATPLPITWDRICISSNKDSIPEYTDNISWIRKSFSKIGYIPVTAWNKLIKREHIISHNLFFKEDIVYEDQLWNFRLGNSIQSIAFNKKSTYTYRYIPNSIVNSNYSIKKMDSEVVITKELIKHIDYQYFLPQFIHILRRNYIAFCNRYGNKQYRPRSIRYFNFLVFFIKCLFLKPERLRVIK